MKCVFFLNLLKIYGRKIAQFEPIEQTRYKHFPDKNIFTDLPAVNFFPEETDFWFKAVDLPFISSYSSLVCNTKRNTSGLNIIPLYLPYGNTIALAEPAIRSSMPNLGLQCLPEASNENATQMIMDWIIRKNQLCAAINNNLSYSEPTNKLKMNIKQIIRAVSYPIYHL